MSEEKFANDGLTFGDQLLGLQGFNAVCAERYRAEISKLLTHRIGRRERWVAGLLGACLGAMLLVGAVSMAIASEHPEFVGFDGARWTFAAVFAATGLTLAGWLLWIAFCGAYGRRIGDLVALLFVLVLCGGSTIAFVQLGMEASNEIMRMRMLFGSGCSLCG